MNGYKVLVHDLSVTSPSALELMFNDMDSRGYNFITIVKPNDTEIWSVWSGKTPKEVQVAFGG
jgi:hypothetical protein